VRRPLRNGAGEVAGVFSSSEAPAKKGCSFSLARMEIDGAQRRTQRIVGERQTPSGLEYEVGLEKTLWLSKATLDTKLVRRYRAEQRAATRVRTRRSSRLQRAGSSVRQQRR
jgi:hypothetical protein